MHQLMANLVWCPRCKGDFCGLVATNNKLFFLSEVRRNLRRERWCRRFDPRASVGARTRAETDGITDYGSNLRGEMVASEPLARRTTRNSIRARVGRCSSGGAGERGVNGVGSGLRFRGLHPACSQRWQVRGSSWEWTFQSRCWRGVSVERRKNTSKMSSTSGLVLQRFPSKTPSSIV